MDVLGLGFGLLALVVLGVILATLAMVLWVVTLPFRALGFVFKIAAALLALPFLLVFAVLGTTVFGVGMLVFMVPAIPFILLVAFIVWLARRGRHTVSA